METSQIIDYAINQTLQAHPDFTKTINCTIYADIVNIEGIKLFHYTSQNNARKLMRSISQRDILEFVLEEVIKNYNAMMYFYYNDEEMKKRSSAVAKRDYLLEVFPTYSEIQKAIYKIANPKVNSVIHYLNDSDALLALVDAITETKYQRQEGVRKYIETYGKGPTYVSGYGEQNLFQKIREDREKANVARSVKVNQRTVNKCLTEVMNGSQLKHQRNEYGLDGTLYATQDIGRRRKNQEDSVLILTHPENPDFKLLVVSDGMGGVELGEKASQYTVQELAKWFQSLPKDYFYYPMDLQNLFNNKIASISNQIYQTYNSQYRSIQSGATLASAIVTEDKTIVSSVGDSRVYTVFQGRLRLLSRDESRVWPLPKKPHEITPEELDELRFDKYNNQIVRCMGDELEGHCIQTLITPNNSYDRLLLFSDGVTDLLSQERIRIISSQAPKDLVTKMLVDEAINLDAIRRQGADEFYNGRIPAGKDNASAAMYARR